VSEDGEYFPLRQAVDASTSNPKVQRAELMTRMRGVEDVARELKHARYLLPCLALVNTIHIMASLVG
jgi:hypothetical protein